MIQKISQEELTQNKVASLPSRPNASTAFGGAGYTSAQLKSAFDRLPLLVAERLNQFIDAVSDQTVNGIAGAIPTGIAGAEGHTYSLLDLFTHIKDGTLATYLKVGEQYLDLLLQGLAPLHSPAFSGTPTAITPTLQDESGRLATTAWVKQLNTEMITLFEAVKQGIYGSLPEGGALGDILMKTANDSHKTAWVPLRDYRFENPTANTPEDTDSSQKIATTAFVKTAVNAAISALKGGVDTAYDTLLELAQAIAENNSDITSALNTMAEKDNKTLFCSFNSEDTLCLTAGTEYRGLSAVSQLSLVFPDAPTEDFMVSLLFSTPEDSDMTYSYTGQPEDFYVTGDDCTEGLFIPIRAAHYTLMIWYGDHKFQGVARRSQ